MPSKDTLSIAPEAATKISALVALIGSGVDAGYAFTKSAGTTAASDVAAPTIAPNV